VHPDLFKVFSDTKRQSGCRNVRRDSTLWPFNPALLLESALSWLWAADGIHPLSCVATPPQARPLYVVGAGEEPRAPGVLRAHTTSELHPHPWPLS
jgi:hypothetical protein